MPDRKSLGKIQALRTFRSLSQYFEASMPGSGHASLPTRTSVCHWARPILRSLCAWAAQDEEKRQARAGLYNTTALLETADLQQMKGECNDTRGIRSFEQGIVREVS